MLIFGSTETCQAIADADSVITVTIYALDNDGSGGVTYKKLYQGQPAAAGSTLFTVTSSHTYIVKTVTIVNTDSVPHTIKLWHGGNAAANIIMPVTTLQAGEYAVHGDAGWVFYTVTGAQKGIGAPGIDGGSTLGIYGDGSDGALDFTVGGPTTAGATNSGGTYTATRDILASSIIIEPSVTLKMSQFRLLCTGTLTNNGVIHCDGGAAVTSSAGVGCARGSVAPASGAGATGPASASTSVAGTAATASGSASVLFAPGKVFGAGGNGGAGGNSGPAGATLNSLGIGANIISPRDVVPLLNGLFYTTGSSATAGPTVVGLCGGSGGSGGTRSAGTTATVGGGGGAGGGVLVVSAKTINNASGIIRANGGAGAAASGAGDCVTGGGGGGGGGTLILIYNQLTAGTETAAGGAKGAGLNGAAAAADGTAGVVIKIPCT